MNTENQSSLSAARSGQTDPAKALYERYLNGDKTAFAQIIMDFKDPLMLFIQTFVKDIGIAEELTQETFVRIGLDKPRFSGRCAFKTWLYAIGRNVTLDYIRSHSREQATDTADMESLKDAGADIEEAYLKKEDKIRLHRAMKKLPGTYRQVLWLSYFEELDNAQIAKVMKKTKHGVETLKYRAKDALRIILEKEGFIYENR